MKRQIIVLGAGGHAKSCLDVIESTGKFEVLGLVEKDGEIGQSKFGYKVLGVDSEITKFRELTDSIFIAIGGISNLKNRAEIYNKLKADGFQIQTIVSPSAVVAQSAKIGEGTIIHHLAYVGADAVIENNAIINTRAVIEHDSIIGSHTHISTGAIVNGNVSVGNRTFIGSGVQIKQGLHIGSDVLINMGLSVYSNLDDFERFLN